MRRAKNKESDVEKQVDTIDRVLSREDEMVPSSGFAAAAMERVREEAALPAPIPFPWKRFVPGLVLAAGVMGWGAWETVRSIRELVLSPPLLPATTMLQFEEAGWVVLALAVSLGAWMLSTRMVRRSGIM